MLATEKALSSYLLHPVPLDTTPPGDHAPHLPQFCLHKGNSWRRCLCPMETGELTWYPCQGSLPLRRKTSVYAKDSKSSLRLAVLPRCACTLAYRTVPLHHRQGSHMHCTYPGGPVKSCHTAPPSKDGSQHEAGAHLKTSGLWSYSTCVPQTESLHLVAAHPATRPVRWSPSAAVNKPRRPQQTGRHACLDRSPNPKSTRYNRFSLADFAWPSKKFSGFTSPCTYLQQKRYTCPEKHLAG